MDRKEILRRLKRNRALRPDLRVEKGEGKGSHWMVYYKNAKATIGGGREYAPGTRKAWFKQLGIPEEHWF